jgi:tripartite-type tricarboxylate transporter receptor subunit TctC
MRRSRPESILAFMALMTAAGLAAIQTYPSKPIRMIVPAGPGGGVDTVARAVGQPLGVDGKRSIRS